MEKAGNVINHLLNNLLQKKYSKQGTVFYQFFNKWEIIVGKKLYGHSKIIDLKHGNLIIAVDHPGWLQMVKMKEKMIIKKVQKTFPQLNIKFMKIYVKEEYFRINCDGDKKNVENDKIIKNYEKFPPGFDEIKDQELKNILKRLYISLLKKDEES